MNMILSEQMLRLVRDNIRSNSLHEDEIRRVEGLGNCYLSLKPCDGYDVLVTLDIDNLEHYLLREIQTTSNTH
jgi:hypothetical protein